MCLRMDSCTVDYPVCFLFFPVQHARLQQRSGIFQTGANHLGCSEAELKPLFQHGPSRFQLSPLVLELINMAAARHGGVQASVYLFGVVRHACVYRPQNSGVRLSRVGGGTHNLSRGNLE